MRVILLTGVVLLLAACGQTGHLYLPMPGEEEPGAGTCRICPPMIMPTPAEDGQNDKPKKSRKSATTQSTDTTAQEPHP